MTAQAPKPLKAAGPLPNRAVDEAYLTQPTPNVNTKIKESFDFCVFRFSLQYSDKLHRSQKAYSLLRLQLRPSQRLFGYFLDVVRGALEGSHYWRPRLVPLIAPYWRPQSDPNEEWSPEGPSHVGVL